MGGRGASAGVGSIVTTQQSKAIDRIANRTRNYKNEQYRIIDENGNVVLEKRGTEHEVAATAGEKRDLAKGAVTIHNHPNGGTFSADDLREFGYGVRQITAAAPEGNYKLTNTRYGTKDAYKGWYDMQQDAIKAGVYRERSFLDIRKAAQNRPAVKRIADSMKKISDQYMTAKKTGKPQSFLDSLWKKYQAKESVYKKALREAERREEVGPAHDWYKKNASKYGFSYSLTRVH